VSAACAAPARRHKTGRSGTLTFATVEIVATQDGEPTVTEERDIVYLPTVGATPPLSQPEPPGADEQPVFALTVDPTLLFRFSALT
jgi:3-methylfumaryl-CoA hydratase